MGNALVDVLVCIDNEVILSDLGLPKGGMTLIDEKTYAAVVQRLKDIDAPMRTGGSAGNAMLALASLGGVAAFIGKTGRDENGAFYYEERERQNVHPIALYDDQCPTGVALTFITPDGERTFATHLGAAATLRAAELRPDWFVGQDYFFIEGYLVQNHTLIETAVDMARRAGAKVCLDLASWNIVESEHAFFARLLKQIDLVFANEDEARAMTGLTGDDALSVLGELCPTTVLKCGCEGARAVEKGTRAVIPAVPVDEVVDTTGAGDFFAGGFLYRHARGEGLEACLRQGAECASAVIRVLGTKLSPEVWTALRGMS